MLNIRKIFSYLRSPGISFYLPLVLKGFLHFLVITAGSYLLVPSTHLKQNSQTGGLWAACAHRGLFYWACNDY